MKSNSWSRFSCSLYLSVKNIEANIITVVFSWCFHVISWLVTLFYSSVKPKNMHVAGFLWSVLHVDNSKSTRLWFLIGNNQFLTTFWQSLRNYISVNLNLSSFIHSFFLPVSHSTGLNKVKANSEATKTNIPEWHRKKTIKQWASVLFTTIRKVKLVSFQLPDFIVLIAPQLWIEKSILCFFVWDQQHIFGIIWWLHWLLQLD